MRNIAEGVKPYQLIAPIAMTATVTGSGVAVTPGQEFDGVAIVNLGAVAGSPTTTSAIVTIEASATSGGTYTVLSTFVAATAGAQVGTKQVSFNGEVPYAFIRAKVTIVFSGGSTPSIVCGVTLLQRQTVKSASNLVALA